MINENKGAILVISGPSGGGKSTLLKEVFKNISNYYFSISVTTREPRAGEVNGVDYIFVSKEEFEQDIENGNFLEYAKVHDNYYGTSLKTTIQALNEGKLVIFDIDVQGHHIVRKEMHHCLTSVFITTPSLKVLEDRLNSRSSDSLEIIKKRLENAKKEIEFFQEYDYLIVNDDLKTASQRLIDIANIARNKTKLFEQRKIVLDWLN